MIACLEVNKIPDDEDELIESHRKKANFPVWMSGSGLDGGGPGWMTGSGLDDGDTVWMMESSLDDVVQSG